MPRDLFPGDSPQRQSSPLSLTQSPELQTPGTGTNDETEASKNFTILRDESDDREYQLSEYMRKSDKENNLHPYVQTLSISNLDSCVALENAAFTENERCSRDKVWPDFDCPTTYCSNFVEILSTSKCCFTSLLSSILPYFSAYIGNPNLPSRSGSPSSRYFVFVH